MSKQNSLIKGYKVFNPDWTCRDFQYEVGKTYKIDVTPVICERGFHFCKEAKDCFNYYEFNSDNKVAEVIAHGQVYEEVDKCATNKIEIVREIPWHELLTIVNLGNYNSGYQNSGNCNSGNCNSGNWNSGNRNSGYWNQGDYCTGDFNISDHETGCFCTEEHNIRIFDIETDMRFREWRNSRAYRLLTRINFSPNRWILEYDMTDEEKQSHPEYKTTSGYLKVCNTNEAFIDWWRLLSDSEREVIKSIPNFNAEKFRKITGIIIE